MEATGYSFLSVLASSSLKNAGESDSSLETTVCSSLEAAGDSSFLSALDSRILKNVGNSSFAGDCSLVEVLDFLFYNLDVLYFLFSSIRTYSLLKIISSFSGSADSISTGTTLIKAGAAFSLF